MTIDEIRSRLENRRNAINVESALEYDYGKASAYDECLVLLNNIKSYNKGVRDNDYIAMAHAIADMCKARKDCKGCPLKNGDDICLSYFAPDRWDLKEAKEKG